MEYKGVYDDQEFFEQYIARRHRKLSPNRLIETPVLLDLLGDVSGKNIIDLGCGDGTLGAMLLQKGAESYLGVEGSVNMHNAALQRLADYSHAQIMLTPMESYIYPPNTFDIVVSQLALHYVEDFAEIANQVFQTLRENGRFVFSVQHPMLTSSIKSIMKNKAIRTDWIVDDYFHSGKRNEPWIGREVVKYHRTIEEYFMTLQQAEFKITGLREGKPMQENFAVEDEYERRMRIPLFLLFACEK